jgi:hypothetical protein
MINGAHFLIYSKDAEADRAFFRDILRFRSVDVGGGWLIFALPPAEIAVHPASRTFAKRHGGHTMMGTVLYLMCSDLERLIKSLKAKKVKCTEVRKAPWGSYTTISLPSGVEMGLYQPTHRTAHKLNLRLGHDE